MILENVPQTTKIPVLLIVFNRSQHLRETLSAVKLARPPRMYIAGDGPRKNKVGETDSVEATRELALKLIDWPCEVKTLFHDRNLGCCLGVKSALDWFFQHEEMGIILEDDCVASQSFFGFCEILLKRFASRNEIMQINGTSFLDFPIQSKADYYFSVFDHSWGWATWRRAWAKFDLEMKKWPVFKREKQLRALLFSKKLQNGYELLFEQCHSQPEVSRHTWDSFWSFAIWANCGLTITPQKNLVTNVGFDETATHTKGQITENFSRPRHKLDSIFHTEFIRRDLANDYLLEKFRVSSWTVGRLFYFNWGFKLKKFFRGLMK